MVETLCDAGDVLTAAGKNVDDSISGAGWTDLINEAEGVICAETETNWLDICASIYDDFKKILQVAAASYAAVGAVQYNVNTYLSITEAQTIMDANVWRFERAMSKLKESSKKTFLRDGN